MFGTKSSVENRLQSLESHLRRENPALLEAVDSYRALDRVAYRMGILARDQSYAMRIPFWPLITVFGACAAGKSYFINHYLGAPQQTTSAQAEDDKFTVICHGREQKMNVLPGLALDADPRFPFYHLGDEIEKLFESEGQRLNKYVKLKTSPAEALRGKMLVESPSRDVDEHDSAVLCINEYLAEQSDLILMFFDAHHQQPDAILNSMNMAAHSREHSDVSKFLYILKQSDANNEKVDPLDVSSAWQVALEKNGISTADFYTIKEPCAVSLIESEDRLNRGECSDDDDVSAISDRIARIEIERTYRIVGDVAKFARQIERHTVPLLRKAIQRWRRRTLVADGAVFFTLAFLAVALLFQFSPGEGVLPVWPSQLDLDSHPHNVAALLVMVYLVMLGIHYRIRTWAAHGVVKWIGKQASDHADAAALQNGFLRNTRFWCSVFTKEPIGWGKRSRRILNKLIGDTENHVKILNDRFANPAGNIVPPVKQHGGVDA